MVEKITTASPKDIRANFINRGEPVVLTDAAELWSAHSAWSFAYIKQLIGNKPALVTDQQLHVAGKPVTIGELIDHIRSDSAADNIPYLRSASIPLHYPELIPDLQPALRCLQPNWMAKAPDTRRQRQLSTSKLGFPELVIGALNKGVPVLHFDRGHEHALITQIVGRKEFLLFPPEDGQYLYLPDPESNRSDIQDPWNPDLSEYPDFAKTHPQSVVVSPGETIFVPSGWWHITRSLEPSIGVTFNMVTQTNWKAFARFRAKQIPHGFKRFLFQVYMASLGAFLRATENFRQKDRIEYWP